MGVKAARDFVRALVVVLVTIAVAELIPLIPLHYEGWWG